MFPLTENSVLPRHVKPYGFIYILRRVKHGKIKRIQGKLSEKKEISSSKLDYTAVFMTLKKKRKISSNIFQKYSIMGPTKWFDEKPVRAKKENKGG